MVSPRSHGKTARLATDDQRLHDRRWRRISGFWLLNRSSRALTLTDDGRQFYERTRVALEAVAEAESSVGRRRGEPSGLLRLGTPIAFGGLHVAPRIPAFLDHHPEVNVELVMSQANRLNGEGSFRHG